MIHVNGERLMYLLILMGSIAYIIHELRYFISWNKRIEKVSKTVREIPTIFYVIALIGITFMLDVVSIG